MELRVGSNIMIHFLIIYFCFSYGTCTCILYTVSCHNYMYYVCEIICNMFGECCKAK